MSAIYTGHLEAFPGVFQRRDFTHRLFSLSLNHGEGRPLLLSSSPPSLLFKLYSSAFLSTHRSPRARAEEPFLWREGQAEGQGGITYHPAWCMGMFLLLLWNENVSNIGNQNGVCVERRSGVCWSLTRAGTALAMGKARVGETTWASTSAAACGPTGGILWSRWSKKPIEFFLAFGNAPQAAKLEHPPANLRGLKINATKAEACLRKKMAGIRMWPVALDHTEAGHFFDKTAGEMLSYFHYRWLEIFLIIFLSSQK